MKPLLIALFVTVGFATAAHAADDPTEDRFGEFQVDLKNSEYCKVAVNGSEWPTTEFERGGRRLIVKALRIDQVETFKVELTPVDPKLGPVTLTVTEKEFKRVRRGRVIYFRAKAKRPVKFPEVKPDEEPTPDGPAKTPEEPIAPPDDVPDL